MSAPAEPLLVVHEVDKRWPRRPEPVLRRTGFELESAQGAWITGDNGAGKTTLARIVAGLILPDAGWVLLDGLSPERDRRSFQSRLGFLSAGDRGLYARLTVRRHLDLWARVSFVPRDERPAAVARVVERFALEPLYEQRVDRISMGQRQRVRIAMAFMHEPRLVLLDEPLTSLDVKGSDLLRAELGRLAERGGAYIWISPGNDAPGLDFSHRWHLTGGDLVPR